MRTADFIKSLSSAISKGISVIQNSTSAILNGTSVILNGVKNLTAAVLLATTALSCVHQFPDESTPADLVLKLKFNLDIDVNVEMNMNTEINTGIGTESKSLTRAMSSETHDIRYIVKFFRFTNGEMVSDPVYEHIFTMDDIHAHDFSENLEIAEGHYRIFVWADYVEQGGIEDNHYKTDGFPRIELNLSESGDYQGSSESRDAYVGYTDIDVVRYGSNEKPVEANIDIHRPFAKYVVISDDLEEFVTKIIQQRTARLKEQAAAGLITEEAAEEALTKSIDLDEFDVRFHYQGDESTMYNAPTTFDIFADKPVATAAGLNFSSYITEVTNEDTGKIEAQLGFDYIFVNGSETHTRVAVGVYNKDGEQVAMTPSLKIPLKRNQVTFVRGSFLMHNVEGGVAVNPGFDGPDYNYEIK